MRSCCASQVRLLPSAVGLPSSASGAGSLLPRRSLHSSSSLLERRADGSWSPDTPRPILRPDHFNPQPPPAVVKRPMKPLTKPRPPRSAPYVTPPEGTHTLVQMPNHYRMQFQLEPATRTLVRGQGTVKAKVKDYTGAEAFTRAPWPTYREIVLNRPHSMHVLSPAMLTQVNKLTQAMELNKDITAVLLLPQHAAPTAKIRTAGLDDLSADKAAAARMYEKSFCGGMDVHALVALLKADREARKEALERNEVPPAGHANLERYFRQLYTFAFNVSKLRTPIVLVLDGLAVGAGAGWALQARYRCATENTRLSFPQVGLGWFPDCGASFVLPRLDGQVGMWLALTGWQVRGLDAVRLNLATHYCESDELHRFGRRIGDSSLNYQFAEDTIEQAFGMFNPSGASSLPLPLHRLHDVLNELFEGAASVEEILARLNGRLASLKEKESKANKAELAFVEETLRRMLAASPSSLKATFALLRLTQWLPLEKCLQLEFRLAQRLLLQLANPLTADLFNAPGWSAERRTLADVDEATVERWLSEDDDVSRELIIDYPAKKEETWYI